MLVYSIHFNSIQWSILFTFTTQYSKRLVDSLFLYLFTFLPFYLYSVGWINCP